MPMIKDDKSRDTEMMTECKKVKDSDMNDGILKNKKIG